MEILKRKLDTLDAHLLNAGGLLYMTYEIQLRHLTICLSLKAGCTMQ